MIYPRNTTDISLFNILPKCKLLWNPQALNLGTNRLFRNIQIFLWASGEYNFRESNVPMHLRVLRAPASPKDTRRIQTHLRVPTHWCTSYWNFRNVLSKAPAEKYFKSTDRNMKQVNYSSAFLFIITSLIFSFRIIVVISCTILWR